MHNRVRKKQYRSKKIALHVANGGHIDIANTSATAENAGMQFFTPYDPDDITQQNFRDNEITVTNTDLNVKNDAGILIGGFHHPRQ